MAHLGQYNGGHQDSLAVDCGGVTAFFRRWVSPGMRLSDLARLLDKPHWLKYAFAKRIPEEPGPEDEGTIRSIVMLGNGRPPPVRVTSEDTVFVLVVFSEPGVYGDLIYLRVSGKHDTMSFLKLLAGETRGTACDTTILEVGFEPDVTALIRFTIGY